MTSCPDLGNLARFGLRAAVGALLAWSPVATAEVVLDGTLGRAGALDGPEFQIRAEHGRQAGHNLFHSFRTFNLAHDERATFSGPGAIRHVVGRVTGGRASSIDGTLASSIPGADLWLMNPAGILFGPNARLEVKGAFHASTAAELRFADGAVFSALDPNGSVLSVAPPEAFGFLGGDHGAIAVDRSILEVPKREALSLVGGDVTVTTGTVRVEAGRVTLAGLGGPGAANVVTGKVAGEAFASVRLADRTLVDASGDGGGTVRIRGGQLVVENVTFVAADNTGAKNARRGIDIEAGSVTIGPLAVLSTGALGAGDAGSLSIQADEVEVRAIDRSPDRTATTIDAAAQATRPIFFGVSSLTAAEAGGDAGAIAITARALRVVDHGAVISTTFGRGDAGPVTITADEVKVRAAGVIASDTLAEGDAGSVTVDAKQLLIAQDGIETFTGIGSDAELGSTGDAGSVRVSSTDLEIRGGLIRTSTVGRGDAGVVTVDAERLVMHRADSQSPAGIASDAQIAFTDDGQEVRAQGNAGEVAVRADRLEIHDGAFIASGTFGKGDGGIIAVEAGQLLISGDRSEFTTGITSQTNSGSTGDAGTVTVHATEAEIRDGGKITSDTFGAGNAGIVAVDAGRLFISGDGAAGATGISSRSESFLGDAGQITVQAGALEIRGGGQISSANVGFGASGRVRVSAARVATVDDSEITAVSLFTKAGDVEVRAPRLVVRNGGVIDSTGFFGPAGDARLTADTLLVEDAGIRTEGQGAEGGRIEVTAEDLISLVDAEVTSNGILPEAGASLITLTAPLIALNASRVTSLTGTGEPLAGSGLAQLLGEVTVISPDSFVAASSNVAITGLESELGSRLVQLPTEFLGASDLLRESCVARRSGMASSFTAMGRGGLPPDPAGPLAGSYHEQDGTAVGRAGPALVAGFGEGCTAAPGG